MRFAVRALLIATALPLAVACSSPTESSVASSRLNGSWYDPNELNPSGYCFHFQLHVEGKVVSGSGQYCWNPAIESLTVSGSASGDALSLTFTGNLGTVVTWHGAAGGTRLLGSGTWVVLRGRPDGSPTTTTYLRN